MSRIGILAVASILAAPLVAAAAEAPHDGWSAAGYSCRNCHVAHQSPGAKLTSNSINSALCLGCHTTGPAFGFPWNTGQQAQAGAAGSSHSWSALATNLGATQPDPNSANTTISKLGNHLDTGGKLKCSTCHDVHNADLASGTVHASRGYATNIPLTSGTGTGTLQLTATPPGAKAHGYVIKISGTNQFKISHDNGTSWFGYNGTTWGADTTVGFTNGKTFVPGTAVSLDDGITTVTFSAAGTFTDQVWAGFYVSYPFLQANGPTMCVSCHQDRNQTWSNVEGNGPLAGNLQPVVLGTTAFSHPVAQALNANAKGYDRTGGILDADGSLQSAGTEGNATNDLRLDGAGNVTCMSCHHPHNAVSNSLYVRPQ